MLIRFLTVLALTLPLYVQAEGIQPGYLSTPPIVSTEGMLKMAAGLLIVLATIGAIAWALKRFALQATTASSAIKIIASTGVGQRERIVLVEIENTRLILGVAPGRINTLHCIDKSSPESSTDRFAKTKSNKFQEQLNQST